jgi:malic enzyme
MSVECVELSAPVAFLLLFIFQDVKVVFYGAGSSAAGVAGMIASLIKDFGVSEEEAIKAIYMVDRDRKSVV